MEKQTIIYGVGGFKVFACFPVFVVSNLGPFNKTAQGPQRTSADSAPILQVLNGEQNVEHGDFFNTYS